jgi:hypothetical protein
MDTVGEYAKKYIDDRVNSLKQVPENLVVHAPPNIPREQTWREQGKYAFVIAPHGNGLDCHRQYEALCLGCIPIVKTSPIDPVYKGLPVLIVKEWSDVTEALLRNTIRKFKTISFNYRRLLLSYWIQKINSH